MYTYPYKTIGNILPKIKDSVDDIYKRGAIYKIPCKDCSNVYVGETGRCFNTRLSEHKRDLKPINLAKLKEDDLNKKTALVKHCFNCEHRIDFGNSEILDYNIVIITLKYWIITLLLLRRLKNGVPQGSVLAPLLFNIYTYDLPSMISSKFAYADDLALLHSSGNWKDLEGTLSQDMSTLSAYLQTWRLKLSHTKTVTTAFHLNNREAKRELKVYNNSRLLPFCPTPTYLGVKLDRSLTFRHHLVALRKKLSSRVTLLRRLVGSGWGAGAKTLRIATLSLVYSTAEYCAPVWCRSAHTPLIDSVLNDALRIVTGCLRPTPTDHLPVLSGIQPAELRRLGATLSLAYRGSLDPDHILHGLLSGSSDTGQVRLRSRRPFVPGARNLLDNLARLGIRASEWTNHKWNAEYCESASRLRAFVPGTSVRPVGMGLPRAAWVKLNRLRTGVGRFHSSMHKWGLAPSPNCECGASEQTADHVLTMCPIHRAPHGARGLTVLDDETRCWLNNITASI